MHMLPTVDNDTKVLIHYEGCSATDPLSQKFTNIFLRKGIYIYIYIYQFLSYDEYFMN